MKAKKRIGTRAFKLILLRDYGIKISEGRIYRLLKSMNLPKMSTAKPHFKSRNKNLILKSLIKFGLLISLIFPLEINVTFTSVLSLIFTLENVSLGNLVIKLMQN